MEGMCLWTLQDNHTEWPAVADDKEGIEDCLRVLAIADLDFLQFILGQLRIRVHVLR